MYFLLPSAVLLLCCVAIISSPETCVYLVQVYCKYVRYGPMDGSRMAELNIHHTSYVRV